MFYAKESALAQVDARATIRFFGLAITATVLPFFLHIQWITGPIINAIMILALFLVGVRSALVICLVPSLMALSGGLLPAVLAPVVPFIMIGNVIFVLSIEYLYERNKESQKGYWHGVIIGAVLKFLFLYLSITWIVELLLKKDLAVKVAQMMSWPQFATAFLGGVIAYAILKWLKRF